MKQVYQNLSSKQNRVLKVKTKMKNLKIFRSCPGFK